MKKYIALFAIAAAALMAVPALTLAQDATAPAAKKQPAIHGKVSAVDAAAMTVTVNTKKGGDQTYTVNSDTKIMKDGVAAKLADIAVGDVISGAYKEDGGKMIATKINVGKPGKPKK